MKSKFAYCPVCMYRTIIENGKTASDYVCPRHDLKCVYSGEKIEEKWEG